MKKVNKMGLLIPILVLATGCRTSNPPAVLTETEVIDTTVTADKTETTTATTEEMTTDITVETTADETEATTIETTEDVISQNSAFIFSSGNEAVDHLASEIVVIDADECIDMEEWLSEEQKCYRVGIGYLVEPDDEYSHKRDYFFYAADEIISVIVEYPLSSEIDANRYVYGACDFTAKLQDVTFDGNDDLIIDLGYAGAQGVQVHCAYIYTEAGFVYDNTFEEIPNYMIDEVNQVILGDYRSDAETYVECKYIYNEAEGRFELVEESQITF